MSQLRSPQNLYVGSISGWTLYALITQDEDQYQQRAADKSFQLPSTLTATTAGRPLTEATIQKGLYFLLGLGLTHTGKYIISVYRQLGGSRVPATDTLLQTNVMFIGAGNQVIETQE